MIANENGTEVNSKISLGSNNYSQTMQKVVSRKCDKSLIIY